MDELVLLILRPSLGDELGRGGGADGTDEAHASIVGTTLAAGVTPNRLCLAERARSACALPRRSCWPLLPPSQERTWRRRGHRPTWPQSESALEYPRNVGSVHVPRGDKLTIRQDREPACCERETLVLRSDRARPFRVGVDADVARLAPPAGPLGREHRCAVTVAAKVDLFDAALATAIGAWVGHGAKVSPTPDAQSVRVRTLSMPRSG